MTLPNKFSLFLIGLMLSCWSLVSYAQPNIADLEKATQLIQKLQNGGYILYIRHGKTDLSQKDSTSRNFQDCSLERNLSAEGIEQTKMIGQALKQLNIKVQQAWSSPFCRCKDTAQNIFGSYDVELDLQFSMSKNPQEAQQLGAKLKEIMLALPDDQHNYAFVGHTSNLKDGLGIWPKPEGVVMVLQRQGANLNLIGSIHPDQWPKLTTQR